MDDEAQQESTPSDDVKAKFREALERKNQKHNPTDDHKDGHSKIHGTHGPADHKRDFRRKSG